jgi:hypothetical protein
MSTDPTLPKSVYIVPVAQLTFRRQKIWITKKWLEKKVGVNAKSLTDRPVPSLCILTLAKDPFNSRGRRV